MISRGFCFLLGLALLLAAGPAEAERERAFRVGLLVAATIADGIDVFVDQMRQLGYEEGRNLVLDRRIVQTPERNTAVAAELIAFKPDVLFATGGQQVQVLKRTTTSIPIVFAWVSDPVGVSIVESLARPGGNITGIANYNPELFGKRLQMISEVVTGAPRVAYLFSPMNRGAGAAVLEEMEAAVTRSGVSLIPAPVPSLEELASTLQHVVDQRANALMVTADVQFSTAYESIIEFAKNNRLPTIFFWRNR
jgi:putative tryptophan/tyrosine transport system substrate-binding protein